MNPIERKILGPKAKALELNLNTEAYGTLAEIGAGQEVAQILFKAGGASGTIAKTMSAYDMTFSDAIYGKEASGRYVCKSRLDKMLDREYDLLLERLENVRPSETKFFVFANSVATKGRNSSRMGHGWLGVKFQTRPFGPANKFLIHVNLFEEENIAQQEALGIIGMNLLYAAFYYKDDTDLLVESLMDNLSSKRLEVDMISIEGEDFRHVDNRILSLSLVKKGITHAVMFDKTGKVVQPSEVLHKKNILALRGSFRPPTLVNLDMLQSSRKQIEEELGEEGNNVLTLCEITLSSLKAQANLEEKDFLARVDLLGSIGQNVLISNYQEYYRLAQFFSRYTSNLVVLALGINNLKELFNEKYYNNLVGGFLESIGRLYSRKTKIYVYPQIKEDGSGFIDADTLELPKEFQHLYRHLRENGYITAAKYPKLEHYRILSRVVLSMIKNGETGWENKVPPIVADTIKQRCLFDYPCSIEDLAKAEREEIETLKKNKLKNA